MPSKNEKSLKKIPSHKKMTWLSLNGNIPRTSIIGRSEAYEDMKKKLLQAPLFKFFPYYLLRYVLKNFFLTRHLTVQGTDAISSAVLRSALILFLVLHDKGRLKSKKQES